MNRGSSPRRALCALLIALPVAAQSVIAQSGDEEPAAEEPLDIAERLAELEDEVGELRRQLDETDEAEDDTDGMVAVLSGVRMDFYGYIKLDSSYNTDAVSVGDFARWVEPGEISDGDDQFDMTAKQTRLGLHVGPSEGDSGFQASGRVEIDFYGDFGTENRPQPQMRHAYMLMEWPDWKLLAGQTSDVISPLWMPTVNYTVGWWQGNVGWRRPQIRGVRAFDVGEDSEIVWELALSRTLTGRTTPFTPPSEDTGSDSGIPTIQSRVAVLFPAAGSKGGVGVSGHWGEEEQDLDASGNDAEFHSWSVNLDAKMPVCSWLVLQGEAFVGENLDAYLGGVGQGFNATTETEIAAAGGWVAATIRPSERLDFNLGAAIDDPDDDDLMPDGGRSQNTVVFGNTWYQLGEGVSVAFELSYLDTNYILSEDADSIRGQLAFIYRF